MKIYSNKELGHCEECKHWDQPELSGSCKPMFYKDFGCIHFEAKVKCTGIHDKKGKITFSEYRYQFKKKDERCSICKRLEKCYYTFPTASCSTFSLKEDESEKE